MILCIGCWSVGVLDVGLLVYWMLDIGCWMLDVGVLDVCYVGMLVCWYVGFDGPMLRPE